MSRFAANGTDEQVITLLQHDVLRPMIDYLESADYEVTIAFYRHLLNDMCFYSHISNEN